MRVDTMILVTFPGMQGSSELFALFPQG